MKTKESMTWTFLARKNAAGDYVLKCYVNKLRYPNGDYFTPDLKDARQTLERLRGERMRIEGNELQATILVDKALLERQAAVVGKAIDKETLTTDELGLLKGVWELCHSILDQDK